MGGIEGLGPPPPPLPEGPGKPSGSFDTSFAVAGGPAELPMSLEKATKRYLIGDTKTSTQFHGGDTYTFSQSDDPPPKGVSVPKGQKGFWVSIKVSGEEPMQGKEQKWTQKYPDQFYVTCQSTKYYDQYTAYGANGQRLPNVDAHAQVLIPNNLHKFQQEDPVGYKNFIAEMDRSINQMTMEMLSQLKKQLAKVQKDEYGSII